VALNKKKQISEGKNYGKTRKKKIQTGTKTHPTQQKTTSSDVGRIMM
jgi:hypothetical protein